MSTLTHTHKGHCFVAMRSGNTPAEKASLSGWYVEVFERAIKEAGYEPQLAIATNAPSSIPDDILGHLAYDEMAVFDLGGIDPNSPPNPNVMYELGIRHAFDLPAVIFISDSSRLPFDVTPQRAIVEPRDFGSMSGIRELLRHFIASAATGNFYQPLRSLRRAERLAAAESQGHGLMKDVVEELADMKEQMRTLVVQQQQLWLGHAATGTAQVFTPPLNDAERNVLSHWHSAAFPSDALNSSFAAGQMPRGQITIRGEAPSVRIEPSKDKKSS